MTHRAEIHQRERDRRKEGRELYSDSDGIPTFRRSVTSYLDILGTKAALTSMTNSDLAEQIRLLDSFSGVLHNSEWEWQWQRMLTFSDSIALAVPIQPNSHGLELSGTIGSIAIYQFELACTGRFLRGGIDVGNAYADYANITGPALAEAASLESDVAVVPRVLLSDACLQLVNDEAARGYEERPVQSEWNSALMIDADSRAFVDYLKTALDAESNGVEYAATLLDKHKKAVSEALDMYSENVRVREKYVWVAHYHNAFCERHQQDRSLMIGEPSLTPLELHDPHPFQQLFGPDDVAAKKPRLRVRPRARDRAR